jgi:hypothetical protein
MCQELDAGRLPPATALRLAHLPPSQQRRELAKRGGRVRAQGLAADTINRFLTRGEGHAIALDILYDAITDVIALERRKRE